MDRIEKIILVSFIICFIILVVALMLFSSAHKFSDKTPNISINSDKTVEYRCKNITIQGDYYYCPIDDFEVIK
jgi:hypothetical protein